MDCFKYVSFPGALYVSEELGDDDGGEGTQERPFKTLLHVRACACVGANS